MNIPHSSGWAPYLDQDERILWEGTPLPGLRFRASDIPLSLFGCLFGGFALFWIVMAASIGGGFDGGSGGFIGGIFPLFGLPFLAVGSYLAFGRFFWQAHVRKHTRYALTTKRGFIAKSAFGRKLESFPINSDTHISYEPGDAASLFFAEEERRGNKGRRYTVKRGFEYIAGGDEVYRLMRQVQQGEVPEPDAPSPTGDWRKPDPRSTGPSTWYGGSDTSDGGGE